MKRKTVISIIICSVLLVMLVLGIVFRYDIFYGFTSLRTIKIDSENTTTSIMTFNIRCANNSDKNKLNWKYRASLISDIYQEYQPSIICMQENKKSQYQFFKKYLKGYDSVKEYRDDTILTECVPIFFRKDMYTLVSTKTFWLSDTPDKMSNTWDAYYNRICTIVVLKSNITDQEFLVANTHLDYKNNKIKQKSIDLIFEKLSEYSMPTIIMGDFNFKSTSNMYQYAITKFDDVGNNFEVNNTATINKFKNEYPNNKIDYMFQKTGSFEVDNYQIINKKIKGNYASDHFPIYAELTIK